MVIEHASSRELGLIGAGDGVPVALLVPLLLRVEARIVAVHVIPAPAIEPNGVERQSRGAGYAGRRRSLRERGAAAAVAVHVETPAPGRDRPTLCRVGGIWSKEWQSPDRVTTAETPGYPP